MPLLSPLSSQVTTTIQYTYDPLNRLTAADYTDGSFFHYDYDAVGNRSSETSRLGTTNYGYDAANRLKTVVQGANSYSYSYNGLNNRLSQTVNSVNTHYTLALPVPGPTGQGNAGLTELGQEISASTIVQKLTIVRSS